METTRFILIISLSLVFMMLWQAWEEDYGVKPVEEQSSVPQNIVEPAEQTGIQTAEIPQQKIDEVAAAPIKPKLEKTTAEPALKKRVAVETDLFNVEINTRGGGIDKVGLLKFPVKAGQPDKPFVLIDNSPELVYHIQGGLLSADAAPTHQDIYTADAENYVMRDGEDELLVPLAWRSEQGLLVRKTYRFTRNSYQVGVLYEIKNSGSSPWTGRSYQQIKRAAPTEGRRLIYTYTGAVISSPEERYEKVDFDDMQDQKLETDITNGWVAMLQHYFVTALVPTDKDKSYRYYTNALANEKYLVGAIGPAVKIEAGAAANLEERIYIGPKILEDLEKIAEGLELTVDYGALWFIAKPLFLVLDKLHDLTGNWGWSIILVTVILKLLFFPLSAKGYKSMANMRRVQPRLVALKERHKDDRNKLNQAMMQIYKEEKINPFGGCFPILVQIPVFIALYWVLLESVELRQATFALWLQDLSSKDPYFVLPLLMGITMFVQQKLNPPPMDPVQQKVMSFLPFIFTVFFAFFPSGLVLYWVVNNVLSIAQQWQITRSLEKAGIASKS